MPIDIRELTQDDVPAWRELRRRALASAPEAFGSSVEDFEAQPLADVQARFAAEARVDAPTFGAFVDGALVGTAGLVRHKNVKSRHSAFIWGMFVAPEHRGQRLGARLLDAIVARAMTTPGLERITLSVTTVNEAARRLYDAAGFEEYGVEPHALKLGDTYLDEAHMVLAIR